jgi:hypothetical protein
LLQIKFILFFLTLKNYLLAIPTHYTGFFSWIIFYSNFLFLMLNGEFYWYFMYNLNWYFFDDGYHLFNYFIELLYHFKWYFYDLLHYNRYFFDHWYCDIDCFLYWFINNLLYLFLNYLLKYYLNWHFPYNWYFYYFLDLHYDRDLTYNWNLHQHFNNHLYRHLFYYCLVLDYFN